MKFASCCATDDGGTFSVVATTPSGKRNMSLGIKRPNFRKPNFKRIHGSVVLPRVMATIGIILGCTFSAFAMIFLYMQGG